MIPAGVTVTIKFVPCYFMGAESRVHVLRCFIKHPLTSLKARKRAEADEKAEKQQAIAAAVAAIEPAPTAPQVAAPQLAAPQPAAPEAPKPEEAAHPAGPAVEASEAAGNSGAPWCPADDVAILSLKAKNKSWNEIAAVLVGRSKNELRLRYKEIAPKEATGVPASTGGNAGNDGQAKNGKQKGQGGKKGKGKQVEEQQAEASASASAPAPDPVPVNQPHYVPVPFVQKPPGPAPVSPVYQQTPAPAPVSPVYQQAPAQAPVNQQQPAAAPAGSFVWPGPPTVPLVNHNEAVVVTQRDLRVKGLLKRGGNGTIQFNNVAVPEGATAWNGAPIIYLDDYDPLDMDDVSLP